jgi:hypothetical protein
MNRRGIIVLSFCSLLLIALLVSSLSRRSLPWRGSGLLFFERRPNTNETFDPYYFQTQMQIVSNIVNSRDFTGALSVAADVKPTDFAFLHVHQLRSTLILDVNFAALDSMTAERVASNACLMLVQYYSTNHPTVEVSLVDTHVRLFRPLWRRVLDDWIP